MVITRKIQIYVDIPDDPTRKRELIHQMYQWRDTVRKIANITITHKFCLKNIAEFEAVLKDDVKERVFVKDLLREGPGMSEQNETYRLIAERIKQNLLLDIPSDIRTNLNQQVAKTFKETYKDVYLGIASLRSYKNNITIPITGKRIINSIQKDEDGRYHFTYAKIPFTIFFGRDRSNNQLIVDRCISGYYKACVSSIQIDDKHKKMFLLLCVDVQPLTPTLSPKGAREQDTEPSAANPPLQGGQGGSSSLYARIDIATPLVYSVNVNAKQDYDSGQKLYTIGTSEYFHRRLVLQIKIRQCQQSLTDTRGGHGRKKKLAALERFRKAETNYVKAQMHKYSRELVNAALAHHCSRIVLIDEERLEEAKQNTDKFVLRNWSYAGLRDLIAYKCQLEGIELAEQKESGSRGQTP